MKKKLQKLLALLGLITAFFSAAGLAQDSSNRLPTSKEVEEIINALKTRRLLPAASEILIFGENRTPSLLKNSKEEISLAKAVAMVGGLSRDAGQNVLIIGRNKAHVYQTKLVVNFSDIKLGKQKDVVLEGGDVVIMLTGKPISIPLYPTQIPKGIPAPYKPRLNDV